MTFKIFNYNVTFKINRIHKSEYVMDGNLQTYVYVKVCPSLVKEICKSEKFTKYEYFGKDKKLFIIKTIRAAHETYFGKLTMLSDTKEYMDNYFLNKKC